MSFPLVRRLRSLAAPLALLLLACSSPSYYDRYALLHPEWTPAFPRAGVGLEEALASIHAPSGKRGVTMSVQYARVFEVTASGWSEIPKAEILAKNPHPSTTRNYLVFTRLQCTQYISGQGHYKINDSYAWYYLPSNALAAFKHREFDDRCTAREYTLGELPGQIDLRKIAPDVVAL